MQNGRLDEFQKVCRCFVAGGSPLVAGSAAGCSSSDSGLGSVSAGSPIIVTILLNILPDYVLI